MMIIMTTTTTMTSTTCNMPAGIYNMKTIIYIGEDCRGHRRIDIGLSEVVNVMFSMLVVTMMIVGMAILAAIWRH